MNLLDTLNQVIDYIENNLDKEIKPKEIELITGCQYSLFQRMFSYISDVSINEYIRRRRLSQAAFELQTKHIKVIDAAIKYGYDSSDAFTVAFKKQHGITPRDVKKKEAVINSYPRLVFSLKIIGGNAMQYKIIEKESFSVIVVYGDVNKGLWNQVKGNGILDQLEGYADDNISLGLCFGYDENDNNKYLVAVKKPKEYDKKYEEFILPKSSWLVFESVGPVFPTLQNTWKKIYGEFIPSNKFKQNPDIPTIEKYYGNDNFSDDYKVEIWIPIL